MLPSSLLQVINERPSRAEMETKLKSTSSELNNLSAIEKDLDEKLTKRRNDVTVLIQSIHALRQKLLESDTKQDNEEEDERVDSDEDDDDDDMDQS